MQAQWLGLCLKTYILSQAFLNDDHAALLTANPQQTNSILHFTSIECFLACGVSTEIAYSKALSKSVCSVDLPVKTLMPQVKLRSGVGMFTADTC